MTSTVYMDASIGYWKLSDVSLARNAAIPGSVSEKLKYLACQFRVDFHLAGEGYADQVCICLECKIFKIWDMVRLI